MVDGDHMKDKIQGTILLLLTTVIWGSAFIAQSVGMDHVGPFTFQAFRALLALLFLFPVSRFTDVKKDFGKKWLDRQLWKTGFIAGIALFLAAGLQQVSLQYTTAGKAGFLTAMYIVLTPIVAVFRGHRIPKNDIFSVGIAVVGLYLLSCMGVTEINKGDLMIMGCALAFAVQINCIDHFCEGLDGFRMNCIQALTVAVLSAPCVAFTETVDMGNLLACWGPLCFAGCLSMGIAYSMQIVGQKEIAPTDASLIMSLESVFALLGGWWLLQERMTPTELLGCGLVFAAVIISQLPERKKN